jgi:hypothetical protein
VPGVPEDAMSKVMVTVAGAGDRCSLSEVKRRFDLADDEIDADFGVIEIDPDAHLYTVLVEEDAAQRLRDAGATGLSGPYSNPVIGAYGPTQSERSAAGKRNRAEKHARDDRST